MGRQTSAFAISRRGFLRTMGVMTGAVALTGFGAPHVARAMPPVTGRIGLLLPESAPGCSLEAGLRLAFETIGEMTLVLEATDGGPAATLQKAGKLITDDRVDLLVGVAGPQVADQLRPLLERTGAVFVAVDSGANAIRSSEQSPWVFSHSLGYWQAAWTLGEWAARELGGKAFIASSFVESGYDAIDAFQVGFEAAGGTVVETSVTHVSPGPFDWEALFAAIRRTGPDLVYALYGGDQAVAFVQAWHASGLAGTIPLVGAPSLVEEALLPRLGPAAVGIRSAHSWAPGLQTETNQAFAAAYRAATGREPDGFAVLGYETAHLVEQALAGSDGAGGLGGALKEARVTGPRGRLRMLADTQSVSMPVYLREVRQSLLGLRNEVIAAFGPAKETGARMEPLREGLRTGWLHTHLG